MPNRMASHGCDQRQSSKRLTNSLTYPADVGTLVVAVDYQLKQVNDSETDNKLGICSSAKKGLQSKVDYGDVKLKKPELKQLHPKLMLIRIKGKKFIDVRLVAPNYASVHEFAVFILVTPQRLFLYRGKCSSLLERSKAVIIANTICDKNGELGCNAKHFDIVQEGKNAEEFWRLLGLLTEENERISEECIPHAVLNQSAPFENVAAQMNTVYEVDEHYGLEQILIGEIPEYKLLHSRKNLIFDFGSEIYVWIGQNADRIGTKQALIYSEELRNKPLKLASEQQKLILGENFNKARPNWCLVLKLSKGVNNTLFQHKFRDWNEDVPWICKVAKCWKPNPSFSSSSSLQHVNDAQNLGRILASRIPKEPILILEETKLLRNSKNIFTENVRYFIVEGEKTLRELHDLWLFRDDRCYVVKWEYRIERTGVRKLDGTKREKETGRPRVAFFYWLGAKTTATEQGLCALALRDFDVGHFPHKRIAQGEEPPLFLQLFRGLMIIYGSGSGIFLVYGSSIPNEARMEEQTVSVTYRAHAVYIALNDGKITILEGLQSKESSRTAAQKFAENIRAHHNIFEYFTSKPLIECVHLTRSRNYPVIEAENWMQPPRLFRLFDKGGEELICADQNPALPFTFRQDSFKDTVMVDQGNKLWLWSDKTVSTFALRVAKAYWSDRSGSKTVICKTLEPDSFKALFATWDDSVNKNEFPLRWDPIDLDELLHLRTKTWPLENVIKRDLPLGVDLNRLDQYLNDSDFQAVFQMERTTFYALPRWKQIELRKKYKLF